MRAIPRTAAAAALVGIAIAASGGNAVTQEPGGGVFTLSAGHAANIDDLRRWDAEIDGMLRTGELLVTSRLPDERLPGREHEYVAQFHRGVPVHGGGVSRQLDRGVTVSLFGTLHRGLDIDTAPALSADEAARRIARTAGAAPTDGPPPELVILPLPGGSRVLAYRVVLDDHRIYFADAADGSLVRSEDAFHTQSAIGVGTGFRGDRKKLATTRAGGRFEARDQIHPGEIVTLDMRRDAKRLEFLIQRNTAGVTRWTANDIAVDTDNDWNDPAVVDLQAHMGWTYDYLAQRHGWNGVDGRDGRILGLVNNDFDNAWAYPPGWGPEGAGAYVFGVRADPRSGIREPRVALHTVAHELMHGVTFHIINRRSGGGGSLVTNLGVAVRRGPASFVHQGRTYACEETAFNILLRGTPIAVPALCEGGRFVLASEQGHAVNEAYSDIFAVSTGFFHEAPGAAGAYEYGSEYAAGTLRSLSNPASTGDAASYGARWEFALAGGEDEAIRFEYSRAAFRGGRFHGFRNSCCYGAQHWNSTILSHAFYLSIEGGRNRDTGRSVQGVGGENRTVIEDIFFHALRHLIPRATSLPQAADAIRQAAADVAPDSDAQRAVRQALSAVGLPPGTGR